MSSLNLFPPPPQRGHTTIGEIDGRMISSPVLSDDTFLYQSSANMLSGLLDFTILREHVRPSSSKESLKAAFLPGNVDAWKRAVAVWHEHGMYAALEELAEKKSSTGVNYILTVAKAVFKTLRWFNRLSGAIYPHRIMSTEDMIVEFSNIPNWRESLIRAIAWHPHTKKFAIALRDDSVKVYNANQGIVPILKCRQQKGISDLSWRPLSASTLAIACTAGIVVWHLDPQSVVTRPSSTQCQWLTQPGHCPVTSVQWSPCAKFLLSASSNDSSMFIWDVSMQSGVPLRNVGGGGVSFVKWSPDGMRVFAATPSKKFRVWETNKWRSEWWSAGINRCKAACWSPDGSILLTSIKDDTVVYSLSFVNDEKDPVGGSKIAVPVIDVAAISIECGGFLTCIGGEVQSLAWDNSGRRLAVSFSSKDKGDEFIAVFCTTIKPVLDISPCGFIRAHPGETPQCMAFQNDSEAGAVLTVCWSSGRVTHIPFVFAKIVSPLGNVGGRMSSYEDAQPFSTMNSLFSPLTPKRLSFNVMSDLG